MSFLKFPRVHHTTHLYVLTPGSVYATLPCPFQLIWGTRRVTRMPSVPRIFPIVNVAVVCVCVRMAIRLSLTKPSVWICSSETTVHTTVCARQPLMDRNVMSQPACVHVVSATSSWTPVPVTTFRLARGDVSVVLTAMTPSSTVSVEPTTAVRVSPVTMAPTPWWIVPRTP